MKPYFYLALSMIYMTVNGYAQVSCDNFVVQQIQMDANQENYEVENEYADTVKYIRMPV